MLLSNYAICCFGNKTPILKATMQVSLFEITSEQLQCSVTMSGSTTAGPGKTEHTAVVTVNLNILYLQNWFTSLSLVRASSCGKPIFVPVATSRLLSVPKPSRNAVCAEAAASHSVSLFITFIHYFLEAKFAHPGVINSVLIGF
jgi:hypothetical protein